MNSRYEHRHECASCGIEFVCRCLAASELQDRRLCPDCADRYRHIRDARTFSSYRTLKRPERR